MDVCVAQAREDAAAAEVDRLRARERGLVGTHSTRDPLARDRERPSDGERGVERADRPVLEDHRAGI